MSGTLPRLVGNGRGPLVGLVAAFSVGQAMALGAVAYATRALFAELHGESEAVPVYALACLLAAAVAGVAFQCLSAVVAERLGHSYAIDFRWNFYNHLSRLSVQDVSRRRSGALAIRFVGDMATMRNWVSLAIPAMISSVFVLPAALLALWFLSPIYAIAAGAPLAVVMICVPMIGRRLLPIHKELRSQRANLSIEMMERVSYAPYLRLLGRIRKDRELINRRGGRLMNAATRRMWHHAVVRSLPDLGAGCAGGAILLVSFKFGLSAANAAAGLAIIGVAALSLRQLSVVWDLGSAWQVARAKSLAIFEQPVLERADTELVSGPIAVSLKSLAIGSHPPVSASIPAGARIVLDVLDGATRMALFHSLAGLDVPKSGSILFSGVELRSLRVNQINRRVHALSLDAPILQGSLRRALTFGVHRRPPDTEILSVCAEVGLLNTVERLGGLDGRVAESARNLSDDEKGLLLLVRAILSKPDLLVIDRRESAMSTWLKKNQLSFLRQIPGTVVVVQCIEARPTDGPWLTVQNL